ncbi:MAG TPA: VOC family protein [Firmicutes bacterium]|jgi:catechol-2,3-dioxygenase|nr:VOC family protein [Bacillota bacterium]
MSEEKKVKIKLQAIVLDCSDAHELAEFYAKLLGWQKYDENPEWISVGVFPQTPFLLFQQEPEYKRPVWPDRPDEQQKSIHLDFAVSDLEAAVAHAVECGAVVSPVQYSDHWTVLFDPAGHPFCLVRE